MKRYTTINFFKGYKTKDNNKAIYIIFTIGILAYNIINATTGIVEIKNLQKYVEDNSTQTLEYTQPKSKKYIDMKQMKVAYDIIGTNNIDKLLVENSNVEIEGKCGDLNLLQSLKQNENVKDLYIQNIKKEGEVYIFNINYRLNEKIENK